jgi:hypothetical protein
MQALTDRTSEFRRRAAETRAKAREITDKHASKELLEDAMVWDRMAEWEEQDSPPPT